MPIPMIINPKLVSYQRLLKVVREDTTNKSVVNVARIACNLFKQIQILSPNYLSMFEDEMKKLLRT